jgi:hypothetical protein
MINWKQRLLLYKTLYQFLPSETEENQAKYQEEQETWQFSLR